MDKVAQYKQIVRSVFTYIASLIPSDNKVETQIITDDEHGHYVLFSVGWEQDDYREYAPFAHIDVKDDGKVWIQHDGTDLVIAQMLMDEGITQADIVLGFRAPFIRTLMPEFAAG
ncbi:MAG: hypothetical protein RIR11_1827 [Bacteroidota bacterium]|jgi:hypothetical protein